MGGFTGPNWKAGACLGAFLGASLVACGANDAPHTTSNPAAGSGAESVGSGGSATGGSSNGAGPSVGGANAGGAAGGGGPEFCPPELTPRANGWRAEYDLFFANKSSMRRYVDDVEQGGGHWSQTYTFRSLMLMFELTGDVAYLDELIFQATAVLAAADGFTWPTGVCSNSFPHSTVVIDGLMLYPLLRAARWMTSSRLADDVVPPLDGLDHGGKTYADIAAEWATFASQTLALHASELRTAATDDTDYYQFPSTYTCVANELMPFNYASAATKTYAALWALTGDLAARTQAERLLAFWYNRTHAYEPSPGATRSRWWGYRGVVDEDFDPGAYPADDAHRPEDIGHADHTAELFAWMYTLGLDGPNATRIDQVAMTSKRMLDRAIGNGTTPAFYVTNADTGGLWTDMFDHLPMSCYRRSILDELELLAPTHLTSGGDYRRSFAENLAELAYFSEHDTPPQCGPSCGDGQCSGPEDCVSCPEDCGMCPIACP